MTSRPSAREAVSNFRFARGWRQRNKFEDEIAHAIVRSPEDCLAVGLQELHNALADRRGGAAALLGRLAEATQARFAAVITEALMTGLERERSMRVAEELATALGRAWDAGSTTPDLLAMASDDRARFRLTAARNLAFAADSRKELDVLRTLSSDVDPRVRWWARFGLEHADS